MRKCIKCGNCSIPYGETEQSLCKKCLANSATVIVEVKPKKIIKK